MTARRSELLTALGLCILGSVIALLAASADWLVGGDDQLGVPVVRLAGGDVQPSVPALAWASLVGALAVVATRSRGRVVIGCVLALSGLGVVASGILWAVTGSSDLVVDGTVVGQGDRVVGWAWLAAAAGALVAASGVITAVRGRGWSGLGSSYEAPGGRPTAPVTDKAVWDALDRGDDPTA